ncbi:MAG: universal stress protein [Planktothrix sp.]|uniref:universal stress protein n=1 Tax=Planktothrix sp. TaxID=3088171 RepID=UPI0038D44AF7
MEYQKILVAIDRSTHAEFVFHQGLQLAQLYKSQLKLFHAISVSPMILGSPGDLYGQRLNQVAQIQHELIEQEINEVAGWLSTFVSYAKQQGVEIETEYQIGEAGYWIRETAKKWDADLVVIGRRNRSELAELFLGSVSNYIVHHVKCSVLVVQHPED